MKLSALPRRKRKLAVTIGAVAGVAILLLAATWLLTPPAETYRPGQEIEGLTDDLARDLPADYPRVAFTDVTAAAGVEFSHFPGRRSSQLPEDMGSGAAWGDYDGDGWMDLYLVNFAAPLDAGPGARRGHHALYRNNGDGTFSDVSGETGTDLVEGGMAAAWADYDNDGWTDLLVTRYGGITLLRNTGDGAFEDVSASAGLAGHDGFWTGVAWGDYDRDGCLDLYVAGYVQYESDVSGQALQYDVETPASINPSSFEPERNLLFRCRGDGSFEEVALRSGVQNGRGRSLSAAWVDLDEDGWIDLYVANDVSDNVLYLNQGDATFDEVSHQALVADYRGAMGIATGDWDGDADVDLFITHWIAQENALYQNPRADRIRGGGRQAPLQFMDVADRYGLGQIALDYIGWGTSFVDYDNDGRLDLFVTNGSTFQDRRDPTRLVPMRDQLFWNRGPDSGFLTSRPWPALIFLGPTWAAAPPSPTMTTTGTSTPS